MTTEDLGEHTGQAPAHHRAARSAGKRLLLVAGAVMVLAAVLVGGYLLASSGQTKPPRYIPEPGPGAYTGLGTWIDVFEVDAWANPEATVAAMAERNIETIYLQSSNYSRQGGIEFPEETARFLDAAHERGIHVVAWYLPGLEDVQADLDASLEAIEFTSDAGEGFDSFALDIESLEVKDPVERTEALLRLSRQLRDEVGEDYPLGAITPNPMRLANEASYWPAFPYAELSRLNDVLLPMNYFGAVSEAANKSGAFGYSMDGTRLIRKGADRPGVPIHQIGGLAEDITAPELQGFLKAVERGDAIGYSLYNWTTTGDADWIELEAAVAAGLTVGVGQSPSPTLSPAP